MEKNDQQHGWQGFPVPVCSPFDALMWQIETMRERARQYAEVEFQIEPRYTKDSTLLNYD